MTQTHKGSLVLVLMIVCGFIPPPVVAAETAPPSSSRPSRVAEPPSEAEKAALRKRYDESMKKRAVDARERSRDSRGKSIEYSRSMMNDPGRSSRERFYGISQAFNEDLHELKADVERLAKEDPSPDVREGARKVLEEWKERDGRVAAERALAEERRRIMALPPEQRAKAQGEAEKARMRKHVEGKRGEILNDLKSPDAEKRIAALLLVKAGAESIPEAFPIIREMALTDKDRGARIHALSLLAGCDGAEAIPVFKTCLTPGTDESCRIIAAERLSMQGYVEAMPVLVELLRSENWNVQNGAASRIMCIAKRDFGFVYGTAGPKSLSAEDRQARRKAVEAMRAWWEESKGGFTYPPGTTTQSWPAQHK